jgi:hypothetical protein
MLIFIVSKALRLERKATFELIIQAQLTMFQRSQDSFIAWISNKRNSCGIWLDSKTNRKPETGKPETFKIDYMKLAWYEDEVAYRLTIVVFDDFDWTMAECLFEWHEDYVCNWQKPPRVILEMPWRSKIGVPKPEFLTNGDWLMKRVSAPLLNAVLRG